jgi:hypothetical protein
VRAFAADKGTVSIAGTSDNKSTPVVALRVPCSRLSLSQTRKPPVDNNQGEPSEIEGRASLLDGPGGRALGELVSESGMNVRVVERRQGFARVTNVGAGGWEFAPYSFDAWVADSAAPRDQQGMGLGVLAFAPRPATHLSKVKLPLRVLPRLDAPIVAQLVPGVGMVVGAEREGLVRIRIHEASGHNEGSDFWVASADLQRATLPLPAPTAGKAASAP